MSDGVRDSSEYDNRLVKVERQLRRWRVALVLQLLLIIGIVFVLRSPGKTAITTENLVIVDADGRQRAVLNCANGTVGLLLLNRDGNVQCALHANDDGSSMFRMNDKKGMQPEVVLAAGADSTSVFSLRGKRRVATASFAVAVGDTGRLILRNADSTAILRAP